MCAELHLECIMSLVQYGNDTVDHKTPGVTLGWKFVQSVSHKAAIE